MLALILCAHAMLAIAAPATDAITTSVYCSLNYAKAAPCRMSNRVAADGVHHIEFVFGERRVSFTGTSQTGWWSGKLDGQPAMGRELNRGHVMYSTVDLQTTFEWWSEGNEHGSY
jgi:hypothetical protein